MARKSKALLAAEKLNMPEKPRGTPGRPSYRYDAKQAFKFLEEMAKGERSMREICTDKGMPSRSLIFHWVRENPEFAALYHEARDIQLHGYVDDTVYISDTETDAAKARVRIDTRRWVASKLLPKYYGDKIEHEHVAQITTTHVPMLESLSPADRQRLRDILERAQQAEENTRQANLIEGVVR